MTEFFAYLQSALIDSGAYLSILEGLRNTLRITGLSLLFGTLLAMPLCALRMGRSRLLSAPAAVYIAVVRGTPVLMLLMALYYVVFASSRMDAVYIAVMAFSLHTAATVAEIFRSALSAVPRGQADAAQALGMGRWERFRSVILPQAGRVGLPVYQNAVISLLQWTSVVGYVSIVDLTRAVNFVGSRTMEPLLMLFVGILLYLSLAYLAHGAFRLLARRRFGYSHRYDRRRGA